MVNELGSSEVEEVNMPELMHSSRRNICAILGLMCLCTALQCKFCLR